MKKLIIAPIITILTILAIISIAFAQEEEVALIDASGAWRLPFNFTTVISDGPLEGLHTGKSAEAIDYFQSNHTSFQVLAPAKGKVIDVSDPNPVETYGFGWLVRINHNEKASYFAHLDGDNNQIFVVPAQNVKQGTLIAKTGNSGNGQGYHLHFEARTSVGSGIQTGNASPIRAIPATWWNTWYSPPPNFQHDQGQTSGGAQYPEMSARPSTTFSGARHLSNQQSPNNVLAGWASNITPPQIALHFGAAPNTSNTDWATSFNVYNLLEGYPSTA